MKTTLYAPMTKQEATFWHKKLSELCGVTMQQNPESVEGGHHTFFTLGVDEPQPVDPIAADILALTKKGDGG